MKKISFGNKTKNGKKGGRKGKKLLLILILLLVVILGVYAAVRMKAEKAASERERGQDRDSGDAGYHLGAVVIGYDLSEEYIRYHLSRGG